MRRTRIVDHRGKAMWILRVEDLPEGASREVRAAVKRANFHRPAYFLQNMGLLVGGILLVTVLRRGAQYDYREFAVGIAAGSVIGILISIPLARGRARRAGKACLEAGLCAACGYQVAGSCAVEADGCVVCPECGAAWLSELSGDSSGAGSALQ